MAPRSRRGRKNPRLEEEEVEEPQPLEEVPMEEEAPTDVFQFVHAGMYLATDHFLPEGEGNIVMANLAKLNLRKFVEFNSPWAPQLVREFYASARLSIAEGDLKMNFNVRGVMDCIHVNDFVNMFDMLVEYEDEDGDLVTLDELDLPVRKWSRNWPLEYNACVNGLNNGREIVRDPTTRVTANRKNLTGNQKLAFKIVLESLLPVKSNDQKLSHVHAFVTHAIMRGHRIHMPSLILRHMENCKQKSILPYGMIISYILLAKNVPYGENELEPVVEAGKIGAGSLKNQEIYIWQGRIWSKWEVFEYFEAELDAIWRFNATAPPNPPKNWTRVTTSAAPGDATASMVREEPDVVRGGDYGFAQGSHQQLTDRQLWESIQSEQHRQGLEMQRLAGMQQQFAHDYGEYQWRQTAMFQAMSAHMGIGSTFDDLFGGYPTSAPAPPPPPTDDHDDAGH